MQTSTKPVSAKNIKRNWHMVDLKGKVLGRSANEIAKLLQGKHKPDYVSYLDMGDFVVVINAKSVEVTGKKAEQKTYTYYSGFPGGLREVKFETLLQNKPQEIITKAVIGKLPKNKLRDRRMTRLFVYPDEVHPYADKFKNNK